MRKLAWITAGFTYFLMVWGNLVSATGSGLACPDWPLCHGTITPPVRPEIILEWGHRLIAFCTSVLIVLSTVSVWKLSKKDAFYSNVFRVLLKGVLLLLAIQIVLGGITVLLELSILVSTTHLINATIIFSAILLLAFMTQWRENLIAADSPKLRRLGFAACIGLLIQFTLGGLVRHGHAGLACPFFPNCLDGFLPIPFTPQTAVAFFHRWWGVLMLGVYVQFVIAARKQAPALLRLSQITLGVVLFQVLLGIGTVLMGLNTHLRATHAALGYFLWALTFATWVRAGGLKSVWSTAPAATSGA